MRLSQIVVSASFAALGVLAAGCGTPEVGAPCLPENVPLNGYNRNEAYIETSSVQCETRVCMVYRLDGDPRENCQPRDCPADNSEPNCVPLRCPTQDEIDQRIYCTCRCGAPDPDFAECDCPAGYECQEVLREGDEGVQGSYCVNARTIN